MNILFLVTPDQIPLYVPLIPMLIFLLLIFIATGMKPHTGDRVVKFEEDNTERRNKNMNRRNGLFKSAYDLDTITGGSTLV